MTVARLPGRTATVALLLLACAGIAGAVALTRPAPTVAGGAPVVGHPAPPIALFDASGRPTALSGLHGKVVLINFFATWCVPCRRELPRINRAYLLHRQNLEVLAVDRAEPVGDVRALAQALHLRFRTVLDPSLAVWKSYRVQVQPVSFWVDRSGTIQAIDYEMDNQVIKNRLRQLGA